MRKHQGFTLIELTIVLVILAIIAAIAVPRYLDLSVDARQAALQGGARALEEASQTNFALYKTTEGACLKTPSNPHTCSLVQLDEDCSKYIDDLLQEHSDIYEAAGKKINGIMFSDVQLTRVPGNPNMGACLLADIPDSNPNATNISHYAVAYLMLTS